MCEFLRQTRSGTACRISMASVAMAASLLFAIPGMAQDSRPATSEAAPGTSLPSTSLPSSIPVKRDQPGEAEGSSDLRWVAIVLAMGLISAAVVIARRRARPRQATPSVGVNAGAWWTQIRGVWGAVPSHEIQRVASTPLSPRHSLHVVVWDGKRLLLGCSDQSIQLLAQAPLLEDAAQPDASGKEAQL